MTSPQPMQPDMGRVVERAASNISTLAVAPLGVQLALAQELAELRGERITQLEKELSAANAELARIRQVNEALRDSPAADPDDEPDPADANKTED